MAVELVKDPVHEYVCDGCGKSTIVVEGEDQPLGIEGTVAEHHGGGGNGGKFWACSRKGIRKASITFLDEAYCSAADCPCWSAAATCEVDKIERNGGSRSG